MARLIPYVVFPGTCKEAIEFYKDILGGEITILQTFGESPIDVPPESQDSIFNSELRAGDFVLKASDHIPGHEVTIGSNISLFTVFPDQDTQEEVFGKLSEGGKVLFPLEGNFGMLVDKYGVQWMLVHEG